MLKNESMLQVLHFAVYSTVVFAKLAGSPFLRVASKFAEELANRHRSMWISSPAASSATTRRSAHNEASNTSAAIEHHLRPQVE